MKQKILSTSVFIVTAIISLSALFTVITPVFAQTPTTTSGDQVQSGLGVVGAAFPAGAKDAINVPAFVHKIIDWALYIAAIVAVIMLIVGGYMYIFSAGNATTAGKGRATMINALIGLTVVVLSYMVVQIVYAFLISQT